MSTSDEKNQDIWSAAVTTDPVLEKLDLKRRAQPLLEDERKKAMEEHDRRVEEAQRPFKKRPPVRYVSQDAHHAAVEQLEARISELEDRLFRFECRLIEEQDRISRIDSSLDDVKYDVRGLVESVQDLLCR